MTIQENKAIARRFFEAAWNQNKTDDLEEYISNDRIHHFGAQVAKQGPNEVRSGIKNWLSAMPDYRCYIEDLIAEGDRVVTLLRFTGTQTGTFEVAGRTLPPSNAKIDEPEILIFRIANGKIVESWATWDRLSVLHQLGARDPRPCVGYCLAKPQRSRLVALGVARRKAVPKFDEGPKSAHKRQPSDHDPLDFIEPYLIAPTVIKLPRTS
jgi:predicted ester cyclase